MRHAAVGKQGSHLRRNKEEVSRLKWVAHDAYATCLLDFNCKNGKNVLYLEIILNKQHQGDTNGSQEKEA